MRWLLTVLLALFALFQYQLWFGEGSLPKQAVLREQVEQQMRENQQLKVRNDGLAASVAGLRDGLDGIEERARYDLGMVGEGEIFYRVTEEDN